MKVYTWSKGVFPLTAILLPFSITQATEILDNYIAWDNVITFRELPLQNNQHVSDEFESLGIVLSSNLRWFQDSDNDIAWHGIETAHVFESYGNPFSTILIEFTAPVTAAGFNLRAGDGDSSADMIVTAFLNDTLVESFSRNFFAGQDPEPVQFTGFDNILFDSISINMIVEQTGPPCCGANIDNVSFNLLERSVPEPSTLALMVIGLAGVGVASRRRRKP